MPEMTGVELLRQVKEVAPMTVRMLLTGYSDLASIVGSVNDGEVFRFISKPWDNQEIQKTVAEAAAIALELAETAATPPIVPETMEAGVLVIDAQGDVFRNVKRLVGGACPVYQAQRPRRRPRTSLKRTKPRSSSPTSRRAARKSSPPSSC